MKSKGFLIKILISTILLFVVIESKQFLKNGQFQEQSCLSVFEENDDLCDWKRWVFYPMFPLGSISSSALINGQFLTENPNSSPFMPIALPMAQSIPSLEKGCYSFNMEVIVNEDPILVEERKIEVYLQKRQDYIQMLVQYPFESVKPKYVHQIQQDFYLSQDFDDILILIVLTPSQREQITFATNISITKADLTENQLRTEQEKCQVNPKVQQFNLVQLSNSEDEKVLKDSNGNLYLLLSDQSRMYVSGPWSNLQVWMDEFGEFYMNVVNGGKKYLSGKNQGSVAYIDPQNNWYFIDEKGRKSYLIDSINQLSNQDNSNV